MSHEIDDLEHELAEHKAQIEAARLAFADRMLRLGETGMRLEKKLGEAYVKAGLPIPRHLGRPSDSAHPLVKAVGNLRAWAASEGLGYSTVKKWVYYGHAPSDDWQRKLKTTLGVPLSTWPRKGHQRAPKVVKPKGKK